MRQAGQVETVGSALFEPVAVDGQAAVAADPGIADALHGEQVAEAVAQYRGDFAGVGHAMQQVAQFEQKALAVMAADAFAEVDEGADGALDLAVAPERLGAPFHRQQTAVLAQQGVGGQVQGGAFAGGALQGAGAILAAGGAEPGVQALAEDVAVLGQAEHLPEGAVAEGGTALAIQGAEALVGRFEQQVGEGLALPQRRFRPLAAVDVLGHAHPMLDLAAGIGEGHGAGFEPAIVTLGIAQLQFQAAGDALLAHLAPAPQQLRTLLGMDGAGPEIGVGDHAGRTQAAVFVPVAIGVFEAAIGPREPDDLRIDVHQRAVVGFVEGAVPRRRGRLQPRLEQAQHLARQAFEAAQACGVQLARLPVEHAEGAEKDAFGRPQRGAGIESQPGRIGHQGIVGKARILAQVLDLPRFPGVVQVLAEGQRQGNFRHAQAAFGDEQLLLLAKQVDRGDGRLAEGGRQFHQVVEGRLRLAVEQAAGGQERLAATALLGVLGTHGRVHDGCLHGWLSLFRSRAAGPNVRSGA